MCIHEISSGRIPSPTSIAVIKIGGSILHDLAAYEEAAGYIRNRVARVPHERWLIVVSARHGETDRLERLARRMHIRPEGDVLDLLWSTGELRSVALLSLCLTNLGVKSRALNVHQSGLIRRCADGHAVGVDRHRIENAWIGSRIAVVPGFFARTEDEGTVNLGRGGSDRTAVLLAAALGAARCEVIKDVAGYHDRDPNRYRDARPIARLSYAQALEFADNGCRVLQREAIVAAAEAGVAIVVRGLRDSSTETWIHDGVPWEASEPWASLIETVPPVPHPRRQTTTPPRATALDEAAVQILG